MADLLTLARIAIVDESARPVLADAILESGWWHPMLRFALQPSGKSIDQEREEILELLLWPGWTGASNAEAILTAIENPVDRPETDLPGGEKR